MTELALPSLKSLCFRLAGVVLVQHSEFCFGFSFQLAKDYNFNLVLVLITKSQKGY